MSAEAGVSGETLVLRIIHERLDVGRQIVWSRHTREPSLVGRFSHLDGDRRGDVPDLAQRRIDTSLRQISVGHVS